MKEMILWGVVAVVLLAFLFVQARAWARGRRASAKQLPTKPPADQKVDDWRASI